MEPLEFSALFVIQALIADELGDYAGKGTGVQHAHLILPQPILLNNAAQVRQFLFVNLQIGYRSLQPVPVYGKTITRSRGRWCRADA